MNNDQPQNRVTLLKPGQPKKVITARAGIKTLGEHQTAFLASNNKRGFQTEDPVEEYGDEMGSIFHLLLQLRTMPEIELTFLKAAAVKVAVTTRGSERKHGGITDQMVLSLVAGVFGYKDYKSFLKAFVRKPYNEPHHFINTKYMHPMSEFKVEFPRMEKNPMFEALLKLANEGFEAELVICSSPRLPYNRIEKLLQSMMRGEMLATDRLLQHQTEISAYTKNALLDTEVRDIITRLAGYARHRDYVEALRNTRSWVRFDKYKSSPILREPSYYQRALQEISQFKPLENTPV